MTSSSQSHSENNHPHLDIPVPAPNNRATLTIGTIMAVAGKLLSLIFSYMSLLFGLFFLGPVIADAIILTGWETPLPPLAIGMAIGGALGLHAQIRGRWL